jgi:hypothetical protein
LASSVAIHPFSNTTISSLSALSIGIFFNIYFPLALASSFSISFPLALASSSAFPFPKHWQLLQHFLSLSTGIFIRLSFLYYSYLICANFFRLLLLALQLTTAFPFPSIKLRISAAFPFP